MAGLRFGLKDTLKKALVGDGTQKLGACVLSTDKVHLPSSVLFLFSAADDDDTFFFQT